MQFEQKLDVVLNEIKSVYKLSESQINLLRKNILIRVKMYSNITVKINPHETSIIRNPETLGDLLINRLINNIREYNFKTDYNTEAKEKGTYTSRTQSIELESFETILNITNERLGDRMPFVDKTTLNKATIKVFNHEIGHALQTGFSGSYGSDNDKFNQLVNNLYHKYPNTFQLPTNTSTLIPMQQGMTPRKRNDQKESREYYERISRAKMFEYLDEIFNEDEALKITGTNKPQFAYNMGNGFSKQIYNYESKSYKITSYGTMMKIIMGDEKTFESMYEDSIVAFEFFDQFQELSNKVFSSSKYQGKSPMLNILNALEEIRDNNLLEESLKLDLFLTMCLQKKVMHELKNPNLSELDLIRINSDIETFKSQMVNNPNIKLQQDIIIENLQSQVINKKNALNQNNSFSSNQINSDIQNLKNELKQLNNLYHKLNEDEYIDQEELEVLIYKMNLLEESANRLKNNNLGSQETMILTSILQSITIGKSKLENMRQSQVDNIDIQHSK